VKITYGYITAFVHPLRTDKPIWRKTALNSARREKYM